MDISQLKESKYREFIEFALKLANDAGKMMKENEDIKPPYVNGRKFVNEHVADLIEKNTEKAIAEKYPEHYLFKGESAYREYEWICDYIDGAHSYSKKHHISVTSVALVHKGETIVAVVYNPWTNTFYHAIKGEGFYVNGELHQITAPPEDYRLSLVDVEWWCTAPIDTDSWLHNFSIEKDVYVLHIGSVIHAACLVAQGVFAAAVLGKSMRGKNHEIAAISLIIQESNCLLTDLRGKKMSYTDEIEGLVFAQKNIHNDLLKSYAQFSTI